MAMSRFYPLAFSLLLTAAQNVSYSLPLSRSALMISEAPDSAQRREDVTKISKSITVRIEGATQGSGVIVKREGNLYTVLTAWHVVSGQSPEEELDVITFDGHSHRVIKFKRHDSKAEIAELKFYSEEHTYSAASIAKDRSGGTAVMLSGFTWSNPVLQQRQGTLIESEDRCKQKTLSYNAKSDPGMSGGPVLLLATGELVAIHQRGLARYIPSGNTYRQSKTGINEGSIVGEYQDNYEHASASDCTTIAQSLARKNQGIEQKTTCNQGNFYCASPYSSSFSGVTEVKLPEGRFLVNDIVFSSESKCSTTHGTFWGGIGTLLAIPIVLPLNLVFSGKTGLKPLNLNCSSKTAKLRFYRELNNGQCGVIVNRFGPDFYANENPPTGSEGSYRFLRELKQKELNGRDFANKYIDSFSIGLNGNRRLIFRRPGLVDTSDLVGLSSEQGVFRVELAQEDRGLFAETAITQEANSDHFILADIDRSEILDKGDIALISLESTVESFAANKSSRAVADSMAKCTFWGSSM